MGLADQEVFRKLLSYSLNADTQPNLGFMDLEAIVKLYNNNYPNDPQKSIDVTLMLLGEYYTQQKRFIDVVVKDEYDLKIQVEGVKGVSDQPLLFGYIESDSMETVAYARSDHGGRINVLIKFGEEGTQIYFDPRKKLRKAALDIICALRSEEGNLGNIAWKDLAIGGQISNKDCWYGVTRADGEVTIVANGTKTHARPKSKIPYERIVEIVRICISGGFERSRQTDCENNICSSTRANPCPWYGLGMARCRSVRHQQHRNEAAKRGGEKSVPSLPEPLEEVIPSNLQELEAQLFPEVFPEA